MSPLDDREQLVVEGQRDRDRLEAYVQAVVDRAPPLPPELAELIRQLLPPVTQAGSSDDA
jgi:hypothetical protein